MKWSKDGKFRPKDTITKAEFNAVLVRMILKSYLPEDTSNIWYKEYNDVSVALGILKYWAWNRAVVRSESAIMLFRAYKEQKFSLQDSTSFVLQNRTDFLVPKAVVNTVESTWWVVVSSVVSWSTIISWWVAIEYTWSIVTWSLIRKNRPQRRI